MSNEFLPYALPEIGEEEINEVIEALRSGWVTSGPKVKQFEQDFADFIGGEVEAIAVNSATAGLHLALESLGIGEGDEVIVPSYTFTASAEIIRYLGATPVLVDVNESDFNISVDAIKLAITKQTKVIIPVHFAGYSCEMDEIIELANKHNISILEDAAHALPCTYNDKKIGTLKTKFSVFSFYANKTMTTGEGGMIVTRDKKLAERCRVMRLHGISRDAFDRYVSTKPSWYYEIVAPGYKYNMTDIAAAMGIHQLKKLPAFQVKREQMAQFYNEELKCLPLTLPINARGGDFHSRHIYPILLNKDAGISREDFISKMSEKGIGCSVHFIPLHMQPYWKESLELSEGVFPIAQSLYEREVSIPIYTKMTHADQVRVVTVIKEILADV